jgi:hypothetical protein
VSALDDEIRETVGRILDTLRGRFESELGSCQDELGRAAQDAGARMAAEAAASARAEAQRDLDRQIQDLRESAAREGEEQRARFTAEIEDLQRRLDESQLQVEAANREIDRARQEHETVRQQADSTRQETQAAREEADAALRDLEAARQHLDDTRSEVESTLRDLDALRRESDASRNDVTRLTGVLRQKEERVAQAARLPDAVRALDAAVTFGEVLENLALQAGREAGRAALFLVKGEWLRDWRTVGFDRASEATRLDVAIADSGLLAEAVRSGEGIHSQGASHGLPEFARTVDRGTGEARESAAWPVSVGGSVVAVLYADGPVADKSDEPYWPVFLEILARHAGRVLEGITVRQAAGLMTGKTAGVSHTSSPGSLQ